ncbi:MAG TPA: ABC transporter permease [Chthoniobacterales bacterium]|nr:ABC transporter permease [Chthoniobacterales bacterium]
MRSFISHLRHTIRRLVKTPGFTMTAILILGLGIGGNTAIYSLIEAVLIKPLPYPQPEELVQVYQSYRSFDRLPLDYHDYADIKASQHSFQEMALCLNDDFTLTGHGNPQLISGAYISGTFFQLFGRRMALGRPIEISDDRTDGPGVAVVSEHFWRTQFHGDPNVIGTNLSLDGRSFQVIGVTPAVANESAKVEVYVPLNQSRWYGTVEMTQRLSHDYACFGRLKAGATLETAKADLELLQQNLVRRYSEDFGFGIRAVSYLDTVIGSYSGSLWLVEAAVACLLLITCANVATLLLVRAQERAREMSVRAALGANRARLVIQLLIENSALAFAGAAIGLAGAAWSLAAIRALAPDEFARFQEVSLDTGALIFVVVITLLTAALSGLFPAFVNSKTNLGSALKQAGERGGTAGRARNLGQSILVAGQVALTVILLIGAGLMARSFQALQRTPLGFDAANRLTADLYLTNANYSNESEYHQFFDHLLTRVKTLPAVSSVSINSALPFMPSSPGSNLDGFWIVGRPEPPQNQLPAWQVQFISSDYFRTMSIPLIRGRTFNEQDRPDSQKVVIISQSVAQSLFPDQDPIGRQIYDFHDRTGLKRNFYTIVGVVGSVQYDNPESQPAPFQCYYPYTQNTEPNRVNFATLVIHTENNPAPLIEPLRKAVSDLDPNLAVSNIGQLEDVVARAFAIRQLASAVVSAFSAVALLLAAVGLYGVLSYSVSQKRREIGVRIALGAQSTSILQLVMRQGLRIVGVGLLVGLAISLALSSIIAGILYGVSATDPLSIAISVLALGLTALTACFFPAFRASRIDPITALRE